MSTLLLVQRKILSFRVPGAESRAYRAALNMKEQGTFLWVGFFIMSISVLTYLIALYISFGVGMALRRHTLTETALAKETLQKEIAWQKKLDALAQSASSGKFAEMEKVSSIKYLELSSVASAGLNPQP